MNIKQEVEKIKVIDTRISTTRKELANLNKEKKKLENSIIEYLEKNNQPGIKSDGILFVPTETRKRKYQNKTTKEQKARDILEKYGIEEYSKDLMEELTEAMKGDVKIDKKLKIIKN